MLAEESGLDARTVRRIEQGKSQTRLRSARALAGALHLELIALVLDDRPTGPSLASGNGFPAATARPLRKALVNPDEWSLKEALYVLSLVLKKGFDGMTLGENEGEVDRVMAALKAVDSAMRTTLSGGGEWGAEEAASVLSLLLARYGKAFGRRPVNDLPVGVDFVQAVCEQAKRTLAK